jgi:hypothetical protein
MRVLGKLLGGLSVMIALGCSEGDDCPTGQSEERVCTACGLAGGCGKHETQCASACTEDTDCGDRLACVEGVCQVGYCL